MKKRYVLIGLVVFLFGNITSAYSPFTKEEHHQIDRQLNQAIPSAEKKEKSDSRDYPTARVRLSKFLSKESTNHYQSENKFVPYSLQNHHSL